MEIIEANSIRKIDEARWDSVTGDVLSMRHRWLRVMEAHWQCYQPHYFLLADEQGPSAAIVTDLYTAFRNLGLMGWLRQRLSLAVRPPFSSFCGVMVRPGVSLEALMPELSLFLSQRCKREKRLVITVSNVSAADLPSWKQAGFLAVPQTKVSSINLPETYDQYLASLRPRDRKELSRTHRRGQKFNVHFETGPLTNDCEQIYALFCEVFASHGTLPEAMPFTAQFLVDLEQEMPGNVFFMRGYVGEQLAGVSLCLRNGTTLWVPIIGLRYEIARPSYLYFLLIDEMMRWSIEQGISKKYGGKTTEREKQRHGFQLEERWLCYRAHLQPLNWVLRQVLPLIQR